MTASWSTLMLLSAAAYLVGSIPFGLVVGKLAKGVDLRQVGSGNIGAANAFRTLGPVLGVLVLILDGLKGTLPVTLVATMFSLLGHGDPSPAAAEVIVGLSAITGHNNSVYLGFKGGKGIATMFGVLLAISPSATLFAALSWALVMALTRYASASSLTAATTIPLYFMWTQAPRPYVLFGMLACILAFVRHRSNIRNLLAGRELRIGQKRGPEG
jgi:glycerol-3-phosphate acyltransferase PlsY